MRLNLPDTVRNALRRIVRGNASPFGSDMEPEFRQAYERCAPFTMTSVERMYALWQAARSLSQRRVAGAIVECGVWRGGSMMLAAEALASVSDSNRELFLFDTFSGVPEPGAHDDARAHRRWQQEQAKGGWCAASLDEVRQNLSTVAYPAQRVHFVEGLVETTVPAGAPERIALLRLDTDLYESTKYELEHLWPRLSPGGILIIDDYGHFEGARRAVDEYFKDRPVFLSRIDYTGRLAVKP